MKIKSLVAALAMASFVMVASISTVSAQSDKEEIELYQALFGMEKKAIVADFLKLDPVNDKMFWELYDQYETERKELGLRRIELIKQYVANYNSLTDEKIDGMVAQSIKFNGNLDKLIGQYYKKIKEASGSKVAGQFFQLENYFLSAIRTSLFSNLPLIGELDKK